MVDIILSRSRPVGNVREIAKVELGIFTARSRNLELLADSRKQTEILSVPVEALETKPSGIEVKKQEKDPLPSSRKTGRILSVPVVDPEKKPSGIEVKNQEKDPLVS